MARTPSILPRTQLHSGAQFTGNPENVADLIDLMQELGVSAGAVVAPRDKPRPTDSKYWYAETIGDVDFIGRPGDVQAVLAQLEADGISVTLSTAPARKVRAWARANLDKVNRPIGTHGRLHPTVFEAFLAHNPQWWLETADDEPAEVAEGLANVVSITDGRALRRATPTAALTECHPTATIQVAQVSPAASFTNGEATA